eukprot:CAMPEP_0173307130 /NCGR_PEP_ID=MMETSP1143-20121109/20971_1 /TAXON_ID=483371 /ORGANISM="non described non described, Strain CCMP2298" /LENGTH=41 /DNA_ID= /DNA_START= /DNA_END= /DNA_ORIENTATION=
MYSAPEFPDAEVPVLRVINPLDPADPALGVRKIMEPLLEAV